MTASGAGGALLIVGSTVFMVGAAIGVPRVFMEPNPQTRLEMLEGQFRVWQLAQVPYAIGPILVASGVIVLAQGRDGGSRPVFLAAGVTLVVATLAWSWDVYLRALRVREFAYGLLPAWPFAPYVLLTNVGLALLGVGLLEDQFPSWIGWTALGADACFLLAYAKSRDIPPFVFYLLFPLIGAVVE